MKKYQEQNELKRRYLKQDNPISKGSGVSNMKVIHKKKMTLKTEKALVDHIEILYAAAESHNAVKT